MKLCAQQCKVGKLGSQAWRHLHCWEKFLSLYGVALIKYPQLCALYTEQIYMALGSSGQRSKQHGVCSLAQAWSCATRQGKCNFSLHQDHSLRAQKKARNLGRVEIKGKCSVHKHHFDFQTRDLKEKKFTY